VTGHTPDQLREAARRIALVLAATEQT